MPPYNELYPVGARVSIRSREELEAFRTRWTLHDPLSHEQLAFADRDAIVASVGFYHGGDPLYVLADVPGVWHEVCLSAFEAHAV
jgi:hypothetical protein